MTQPPPNPGVGGVAGGPGPAGPVQQPYPPVGHPAGPEQQPYPPVGHPAGPPPQWVPAVKPEPLPVEPRAFHHFYRTARHRWWKPLALIGVVFGSWFLLSQLLAVVAIGIDVALGTTTLDDLAAGDLTPSPSLITANNLGLALFIPAAMLGQWLVYGQRPRWLSSVQGGLRWRWLWICAAVIVPIWVVYSLGELFLTDPPREGTQVALWLTITVLTVPLQAAGEEYGLRGTMNRALSAWFAGPQVALAVGAVGSSLVFMSLHFATDPWLNVFYFGFGMIGCLLCWRTGGLEAAIVLHVVNNLLAFALSAIFTGFDGIFERSEGAGSPWVLVGLALALGVAGVLDLLFRRSKLRRATAPGAPATQPWSPQPPVLPAG